MAQSKTNAMRILDKNKVEYRVITYDAGDGHIDGISVCTKLNQDPKFVYKTLVTRGASKTLYVFVIPVDKEINLKKAAKEVGEKHVEMIHVKELLGLTGYIRGGCSPVGMKKAYKTVINDSAKDIDKIIVSGGKIGLQIELTVDNLLSVVSGELKDIIM
jgi:Cys-tRNA(Pro)/Cys-tRNA(Cys) deacylase